MRSPKLIPAVMAAAALLALATAGAAGARSHPHLAPGHGGGPGACRLSLNVAPRLVTSGETVLAYGQGACSGGAEAGQTVTVYQRSVGSSGYSIAGTTTTDSHGFYQVTSPALTTNTAFYATMGATQSRHQNVRVAAQVALVGPAEGKQLVIRTGRRNAVTFTGTVSPNDAGAEVVLQRQNAIRGDEWHRIGVTIVNGSGGFAITHAFGVPGPSDIRVVVRANRRNVPSPSNILNYEISQAQNPSLTILSSTDPLPYGGGSTVISGTLAGEPNTVVTLQGHATGKPYTTVTTAMTNSEGKYAFAPQSPLNSIYYRVQGGGRSSAVLYEGVKYVLTLTPPVTTVQSGQPVTFSGTVTPARAGHAIYLERQNVSGTGFHTIAVGTVAADGSYSITRLLYPPGAEVLRVKIPGDTENAGSATEPVTITVTPVPSASKLTPEPNGNSGLPPVGQL
ncbi:MAG: hypothetical protein ACLQBB_13645 [Solirubrobacteraceae bacterium]